VKSRKKTLIKVATQLVVGVVIGLSVGVMYYRPQSTLGGAAIYFIILGCMMTLGLWAAR
jgi:uncharacterized membrane protein YczE